MKVLIQRDQAVWERETFYVDVPDNLPEDELSEAINQAVNNFYTTDPSYSLKILDEVVYNIDVQVQAFNEYGMEIAL